MSCKSQFGSINSGRCGEYGNGSPQVPVARRRRVRKVISEIRSRCVVGILVPETRAARTNKGDVRKIGNSATPGLVASLQDDTNGLSRSYNLDQSRECGPFCGKNSCDKSAMQASPCNLRGGTRRRAFRNRSDVFVGQVGMVSCDRTIDEPDHNIGAAASRDAVRRTKVNRRHTGVSVKNLRLK
jgi:hypothetical protein